MELELIPRPSEGEGRAVAVALERAEVDLEPRDDAYGSAWRHSGLREGVARSTGEVAPLGPEPSLL